MIRIGKYGMKSDANCWMVGEPTTRKDKDGNETVVLLRPVYPSTLQTAAKWLYEATVRDADPQSLAELKEAMDLAAQYAATILAVDPASAVVEG